VLRSVGTATTRRIGRREAARAVAAWTIWKWSVFQGTIGGMRLSLTKACGARDDIGCAQGFSSRGHAVQKSVRELRFACGEIAKLQFHLSDALSQRGPRFGLAVRVRQEVG